VFVAGARRHIEGAYVVGRLAPGVNQSVDSCRFCGRPLAESSAGVAADDGYCSDGCQTVAETLPDRSGADASTSPTTDSTGADEDADALPTHLDRTFLRVDGMHSATCEAYLETVAEHTEGVVAAEASYVTESIRLDYDPDTVGVDGLAEALSVLGYEARPREEAEAVGADEGLEEVLGYRYAAGVVFASFLMLPYLLVIYPVHVTTLLDVAGILSRPENGSLGSNGGPLIIPVFVVLTAVVLFFTGLPMLRGAYIALKLRRPNTDLLVAVTVLGAYCYSIVMGLLGRVDVFYDVAVVVAAGVVAASYYEALSKREALDSLTDLTLSRATEARRFVSDGSTEMFDVEALRPGDRVLVRQGERVPVDGELAEGECTVDEAVVTGESTRVLKREGDSLVGGSVVTSNAAVVRVADDPTSGLDRIRTSVWEVQSATHEGSGRADRLAARAAPVVAGLAVVGLLLGGVFGGGVGALTGLLGALLVASPWGLGLATPLSVARSVREALDRGVVVFDETVLERLRGTDVVVFDKTGTLTTGRMEVLDADAPTDLLRAAAALERRAAHPAAEAVVAAFGATGGGAGRDDAPARPDGGDPALDAGTADGRGQTVDSFTTHAMGVEGRVDGAPILVGSLALFEEQGWSVPADIAEQATEAREAGHLPVVVGREGAADGIVVVGDEPREGWQSTLQGLARRGVEVVVLTGDSPEASARFAESEHVERVFAGVPPEGKTETVRRLQADNHVTMVGDGTNDAPALAAADLGIALGSGTALASEAADLAIVDDDLSRVGTAFDLADASRRRLVRNTGAALVFNALAVPLALAGALNPVLVMGALLLTVGLVVGNSMRPLLNA
jgi:heavy metal translocating P-type ATPase